MWSVTDGRDATEPIWTAREVQVLDSIARGLTNGQIASELGISFATAKWHVSEVITKLGVASREEVAVYWRQRRSLRGRAQRSLQGLVALTSLKVASGVAVAVAASGIAIATVTSSFPFDSAPSDASMPASTLWAPAPPGRVLNGPLPTATPEVDERGCPRQSSTGYKGLLCSYTKYPAVAVQDKGSCDLSGASLAGNMAHIDLSGCNLRGASIRGAMLNGASLAGADLTGADLSGSSVAFADLTGAVLRDVVANPGVFTGSLFDGADLTGAQLGGAIVGGVSWSGATCPDGTPAGLHARTCVGTPGLENPPTTFALGAGGGE